MAQGTEIDKDVVRRILSAHYRPESVPAGPSQADISQSHLRKTVCGVAIYSDASPPPSRTHWVLVVMVVFARGASSGLAFHCGAVNGVALCRMFQRAIRGHSLPKYLSSDHDPLYRFHQWQANLRILEVTEIKSYPIRAAIASLHAERLIKALRREYLDRILFWTTVDLGAKLTEFQHYYNGHRTHAGLKGGLPEPGADGPTSPIDFQSYRWRRHCRGLYQTPIAA